MRLTRVGDPGPLGQRTVTRGDLRASDRVDVEDTQRGTSIRSLLREQVRSGVWCPTTAVLVRIERPRTSSADGDHPPTEELAMTDLHRRGAAGAGPAASARRTPSSVRTAVMS